MMPLLALLLLLLLATLSVSNAFFLPPSSRIAKITTSTTSTESTISTTRLLEQQQQDNEDSHYVPRPSKRNKPQGGDMAYIESNIQRQMNTYKGIRESGASVEDCVRDVYARAAPQTTCWYIGKVAFTSGTGVTEQQAVAYQLNLIEEHATRLRPVELGRAFGRIEFYTAPGDSELDVSNVSNQIALTRMPRYAEGCENVSLKEAGFFCEVVTNQGIGFGVERALDGSCLPMLNDEEETTSGW
eukprot:CAMPEP_0119003300 /NCGR_PEP_ID=MMETSP1176-20130426/484_1 /TAXON_ID=265551 /ORGANISM="Synedropsis recta cf, Strain CCMP1620" /LENGTH=242 /DNA_ID=CAMNT_0006954889 /DNA_START=38 /DNA_END=766 /DNA_ORIENTATION=+